MVTKKKTDAAPKAEVKSDAAPKASKPKKLSWERCDLLEIRNNMDILNDRLNALE